MPRTEHNQLVDSVVELDTVITALGESRFTWTTESELQHGVAAALEARGLDVEFEVRVDARNRLDLKVGRVGIEVKIDGTWRSVRRQLERYAELDAIDALVLVTSRPSHRQIESRIAGKRVVVHRIGTTL